jgi:hypothetical protein
MAKKQQVKVNLYSFAAGTDVNTPSFVESKADWIPYGADNNYDGYLIDLLNTSTKHNSLIKKKVNMTVGNGFKETISNKEYLKNSQGKDDLNTIAFKNGYDLMVFGGYCRVITWSKDKKTIARQSFVGWDKVRIAKEVEEKENPEMYKRQQDGVVFYYISSDWTNPKKGKNIPEIIQGFSEKYKDEATQLIHVSEYRPSVDYYTYPDYISSVSWIELDKEIATFHLSSVNNGFTPSMIISFKGGIPSDDEMKSVNKQLQKQYAGSKNGSKVFTTYSENSESAPEFIPVNLNSSDERFLQLEEQIQQNIIIAHGASPIVAGIAISGKMGSSDEVIESETVFQKNVIDSKRKLLERSFNMIADINGVEHLELEGIKSFDEKIEENKIV